LISYLNPLLPLQQALNFHVNLLIILAMHQQSSDWPFPWPCIHDFVKIDSQLFATDPQVSFIGLTGFGILSDLQGTEMSLGTARNGAEARDVNDILGIAFAQISIYCGILTLRRELNVTHQFCECI
jgi:hypothetical protein